VVTSSRKTSKRHDHSQKSKESKTLVKKAQKVVKAENRKPKKNAKEGCKSLIRRRLVL
jgi:hypothetical protein